MPGIAEWRVPCQVKVQAFSWRVKVAVEGKAILRAVLAVAGSSVFDLESRVAHDVPLIHVWRIEQAG